MTFAEKLKGVRKRAGMSQEKLAEKLGVSRQAVTKWETDGGMPDIENIMAISALFHMTIDELLSEETKVKRQEDYLFESVTEYDINGPKRYDIKLGGANRIVLTGYEGEKIRVRLASDALSTIQSDLKLKIDDIKGRIDLDMSRRNQMTEAVLKESLYIFVQLPRKYVTKVELSANTGSMELRSLTCDSLEFDGNVTEVLLDAVEGTVELNCSRDMNIVCRSLCGAVEINQISATSRICVPEGAAFAAVRRGIGTSITYEKNGKPAESFADEVSEHVIELNGMKSELVICTTAGEDSEDEI